MNLSEQGGNLLFAGCVLLVTSPFLFSSGDLLGQLFTNPGFLFFFIPFSSIIIYVWFLNFKRKKAEKRWKTGVFDDLQKFNEGALLEAYIRLGGLMLRTDREGLSKKMTYMHRYFREQFENTFVELGDLLTRSFNHPVDLNSIAPWLKKNLPSLSQRSQLIYFLAGLCAVDGSINPAEKHYLIRLSDLIGITRKDFDSIMAMYEKYEDAYEQEFKRSKSQSKSRVQYKKEKAAEILGVSVHASTNEIKKAYRSLAKVHHPDRFANESESQQNIAKERFVKIQLAYELLLN